MPEDEQRAESPRIRDHLKSHLRSYVHPEMADSLRRAERLRLRKHLETELQSYKHPGMDEWDRGFAAALESMIRQIDRWLTANDS
jgi:hypothetical protein